MSEHVMIPSGAASLAYDTTGEGLPIVCLHAGVADRRVWVAATAELADRYEVHTYDRRGFGETTYTREEFSHVADLKAVVEQIDSDRIVLIGNSLGGRVALDYTLAHPDRVQALILIAPAISGSPMPEEFSPQVTELDAATESAAEAGDLAEVNRLEAHLWLDGPQADEGRVGGAARDLFLDMNGRALRAPDPGDEVGSANAWDHLEDLAVPTLMLVGDRDLAYYRIEAQQVVDRAQNARYFALEGVAHLPMLEQPGAFASIVLEFVASA